MGNSLSISDFSNRTSPIPCAGQEKPVSIFTRKGGCQGGWIFIFQNQVVPSQPRDAYSSEFHPRGQTPVPCGHPPAGEISARTDPACGSHPPQLPHPAAPAPLGGAPRAAPPGGGELRAAAGGAVSRAGAGGAAGRAQR